MRRADIIGGIGFAVFALLMILVIIPGETEDGTTYGLSPYFYPTVMSVGILICGLGLVWQNWREPPGRETNQETSRDTAADPQSSEEIQSEDIPITSWQLAMFLLAMALIVVGVWLIKAFGILIFGPLLIGAIMVFLGERDWRIFLPTILLPVGVVYLIVTYVLRSPLP